LIFILSQTARSALSIRQITARRRKIFLRIFARLTQNIKMKRLTVSLIFFGLILTAAFLSFSQDSRTSPAMKNPRLVVKKEKRELQFYDDGELIKTYKIALGFAPEGDKETQGDGKTPEGVFYVFTKNPKSRFHLSLGLSYPNIEDARRGLQQKIITKAHHDKIVEAINAKRMPPQNTALGGEIYIHGGGKAEDWSWGCIALEDEEIRELFETIPVGTEVEILP